jgi:phage shock protein C
LLFLADTGADNETNAPPATYQKASIKQEHTMTDHPRRLYRSQTDRLIGGVCGGLAEYLQVDSTVVRVLWILLTLLGGSGVILYLVALFVVPPNPTQVPLPRSSGNTPTVVGIGFIIIGTLLFLDNMELFNLRSLWRGVKDYLLPLLLILLGGYFLARSRRAEPPPAPPAGETTSTESALPKRLRRSLYDRKLFGVCGGLAEYFDVDSSVVRILFAIFTLLSLGFGIVVYLGLWLLMPEHLPEQKST